MDSLTQAALGAAVGIASMGRRQAVWRSALAGAVLGTLPDLDVLFDKGDPVRNMVMHRAESHAFFWQALATPIFAAGAAYLTGTRELLGRWCFAVFLIFATHAALDAMTVYGTRLALPFSDYPFATGSLFIIDPAYTLPLLFGLGLALFFKKRGRMWNTVGLLLSTTYACWSLAAQEYVTRLVEKSPEAAGLGREAILVTATPLNTVLWRIVLVRAGAYEEGYVSLFDSADGKIGFERFDRGAGIEGKTAAFEAANLIRHFSRGFYALADDGQKVWITDLRMGWHPHYIFSFAIGEHQSEPVAEIIPEARRSELPAAEAIRWLWGRIWGSDELPPR